MDDDEVILDLARACLQAAGKFEVRTFRSSLMALSELADEPPQLVLLDVVMPKMDGIMFLKLLRQQESTRDVPVILITGRPEKAFTQAVMALGVIGMVAKPLDPMALADRIHVLWQKHNRAYLDSLSRRS